MELISKVMEVYENYQQLNREEAVKPLENTTIIRRKIEVFNIYKDYLKGKNKFLDWGCKSGIVGYTIRHYLGDNLAEIHGCDIQIGKYQEFIERASLIYTPLKHPYQLPYGDNYFDVVIGNGVLEHVANDSESLKEIYRILKNDGYFIITFLPNHLSYTEFFNRVLRNGGHRRRYSLKQSEQMLLHSGFLPIKLGYHQVFPSLASLSAPVGMKERTLSSLIDRMYDLNKYAEKLWPIYKFSANIFAIAQKKASL